MADYQTSRPASIGVGATQIDAGLRAHMNKVYGLMSVAMLVTGGVAWSVGTSDALLGVYLSRFQRPATGEDVSYMRLAYTGSVGDELPGRTLDHGIVRTLWMTLDELQASRERHRSPLVLQCALDHLAGRRYALDLVSTDASIYAPQIKR